MWMSRREMMKTSLVLPLQRMLPPTEYQSAQADGLRRQPFLDHTKEKYGMRCAQFVHYGIGQGMVEKSCLELAERAGVPEAELFSSVDQKIREANRGIFILNGTGLYGRRIQIPMFAGEAMFKPVFSEDDLLSLLVDYGYQVVQDCYNGMPAGDEIIDHEKARRLHRDTFDCMKMARGYDSMFFMAIDGQRHPGPLMLIGHHAKYYDAFNRLNESRSRGSYDAMVIEAVIGDMKTEPRTPNLVFEKKTGKSRSIDPRRVAELNQSQPSAVLA